MKRLNAPPKKKLVIFPYHFCYSRHARRLQAPHPPCNVIRHQEHNQDDCAANDDHEQVVASQRTKSTIFVAGCILLLHPPKKKAEERKCKGRAEERERSANKRQWEETAATEPAITCALLNTSRRKSAARTHFCRRVLSRPCSSCLKVSKCIRFLVLLTEGMGESIFLPFPSCCCKRKEGNDLESAKVRKPGCFCYQHTLKTAWMLARNDGQVQVDVEQNVCRYVRGFIEVEPKVWKKYRYASFEPE